MNMKMNMKDMKKMRGFMCQTPAATAVCMSNGDLRSVILPRTRPDRTLVEHARLLNNPNYARLVESRRRFPPTNSTTKRSASVRGELQLQLQPKASAQLAPSLPSSNNQIFQVVVMRVSLHCQGCAGKVKKHLSKMEGVTSFSIDLESKRVTVRGHVSPVGVLESISKVKKAEFWP